MWKAPDGRSGGILRARRILSLAEGVQGDAVWWEGDTIRAIGRAIDLDRQAPASLPRYELPESLVTPGFVDGHTHFAMWALGRRRVQLAGAATRGDAVARVAAAQPVQGWVVGQGWDANGWRDPPDRHALDAVQSGPVYLDSLDVHAAWLNSPALAAAGIDRTTPDPFGGRIVRDASGEPTGLLLERAVELVARVLPDPPRDLLDAALREAQEEAHGLGVTGIQNVEGLGVLAAFSRLEAAGDLALRVLFHPPVAALPDLVRRGVRSGVGNAWLTVGGVKMFLDGSLGSRTAWMLGPYEGSRDRGMPITGEAEAHAAMRIAANNGIAATVHAIGDAAVRRALDLMTGCPRSPSLTASSTSSASTSSTLIARQAPASWSRCSRPTSSPTFPWWTATGAVAARGPMPSARCCSVGRAWCSGAMCRWPRSTHGRACSPPWSAGASASRRWWLASGGEARVRGRGSRVHGRRGARGRGGVASGHAGPGI